MRKIDRQTLELFLVADEIKFGVKFEQYNNGTLQGVSEHGYIEFEYQSDKPSVITSQTMNHQNHKQFYESRIMVN